MLKIHVNRNRESLGQFTPEDVAEGLQSGRFLPTDLGWHDGLDSWKPLAEFTDLPAPDQLATTPPAPGEPVELEEVDAATTTITPAWEGAPELPPVPRIVETVKDVLTRPSAAFANVRTDGPLLPPLIFTVLVGTVTGIISTLYQLITEKVNPEATGSLTAQFGEQVALWIYLGVMVLMPIFVALWTFISAALFHLSLMLIGEAKKPFAATFRVISYSQGATSVVLLMPFCGGFIQGIWNLVVLFIGIQKVHGISTAKAVICIILPLVLCCGLVFALYALALGAGAAAAGAAAAGLVP